MKLLLTKGAVIGSLTLTAIDLTAQGYMYIRNEAMFAAKSLGTAVVLGTAEDLGYDLRPRLSDSNIRELVSRKAKEHGISEALMYAVVGQESSFNPQSVSELGAIGLGQVMPFNAKRCSLPHAGYLKDPEVNLDCSAFILKQDISHAKDDVHKGIQAYFGGAKCVDKPSNCPLTQKYVKEVLQRLAFGKVIKG